MAGRRRAQPSIAGGAGHKALLALALALLQPQTGAARAQGGAGAAPLASTPLAIDEAIALARSGQPAVAAFDSDAVASEQAAIAAMSLPDPEVSVGVQNLPVTGRDAFSPTADFMTMYTIGVMREQVRRSRREAAAAQLRAEAVVRRAAGSAEQRRIERGVMLAWVDAVAAAERQRLLARLVGDLRLGRQVIEAAIPTGASSPALALEAQAEIALAEAQLAGALGAEQRARGELGRWIGAAAQRPLPHGIPQLAPPPELIDHPALADHPHIRLARAEGQAAERGVALARADRRPNLSWSVMYGWRPSYGDMVSAQVSVPLPLNRSGLQDRRIAEAEARAEAARLRTDDGVRDLGGELAAALADYRGADARIAILRDRAIPALEASFKAAEARYAGGQGTLELPLAVVRRYVEAKIELLELEGARARAAAELLYLGGGEAK